MGLSILGEIIFILRAWRDRPAMLIVLVVGLLLALAGWRLDLPYGLLALVAATGMIAILDWFTLQGGARAPALSLIHAGVLVAAISFASLRSIETLWIFGIVLACMGVWHLVLARIPRLTKAEFPISPNNKVAIASSVSILVRRVIAQVFFESGWAGVRSLRISRRSAARASGSTISTPPARGPCAGSSRRSAASCRHRAPAS
jgi:hypothetical protein